MERWAADFGGKVLDELPYSIDAMRPPIENASEIVFNIGRSGIGPGTLTAEEFQFVIGNPDILAKTLFIFGATF